MQIWFKTTHAKGEVLLAGPHQMQFSHVFCFSNTKAMSDQSSLHLLPLLARFLISSLFSASSPCNQQAGVFLASIWKSAKVVDCKCHLITHLLASLWKTRWHTRQAENKPPHLSHSAENDLFASGGCVSVRVGQAAG